jgi:hypothetical protein
MEDVIQTYMLPYDPKWPVVCFDEASKQLFGEVRPPERARPGAAARVDYEYERKGVADLFLFFEPLRGWRRIGITPQRRKVEWAWCVKQLLDENYPDAERLVLVCDNLNTHTGGALWHEVGAWEGYRNRTEAKVRWRFTTEDARIKLEKLYPVFEYPEPHDPHAPANL